METQIIVLKSGAKVLVDAADFDALALGSYTWYQGAKGKVTCNIKHQRKPLYIHRLIMQAATDERVLHVSGDPLDNRRSNLIVTKIKNLLDGVM